MSSKYVSGTAHASGVGGTGVSNAVSTLTKDFSGHGRRATSATAASLQVEPSTAKSIFISSPALCANPHEGQCTTRTIKRLLGFWT